MVKTKMSYSWLWALSAHLLPTIVSIDFDDIQAHQSAARGERGVILDYFFFLIDSNIWAARLFVAPNHLMSLSSEHESSKLVREK